MQLLGGRYETLKAIASGGMATVHLGRAVGVGGFERLVAIKVMHPHIACEPEFVAMFLDEARLAARIRHPNVVATIDVQEAEDGLFLVMEFVDGPSLASLTKVAWRAKETLPVGVVLRVMLDTLAGLHEAHELVDDEGVCLQLVHRDVSPANILVGADGVVRITDFGVARAETRLSSTRGGQLKGKIPYMPPEQLLGETIDRRCDVYAAGTVLWESLVGRRLFQAGSEGALVQQIIQGPSQSPRAANPAVPEAVDRVCMRALATSLSKRLPSAAAFAEAIEEAAAEDGITIATSRAVAAYVQRSGAHTKLDPKELGALKRAPSGEPSPSAELQSSPSEVAARVAARGSVPSAADHAAVASQRAEVAGIDAPVADLPSAPSQPSRRAETEPLPVTATDATISARTDLSRPRPRRTGLVLGAVVAAVGCAVVAVAVFGGRNGATEPAEPGGSTSVAAPPEPDLSSTATAVASSTGADESPVAEPLADAASSAAELPTQTPSATSAASSAPATTPRAPRPPPKAPKPQATPKGPKTPPPPSTSYNPDRL